MRPCSEKTLANINFVFVSGCEGPGMMVLSQSPLGIREKLAYDIHLDSMNLDLRIQTV